LKVCPGHEFDFQAHATRLFGQLPLHPEVGHFRAMYVGYACDQSVRVACQSGGLVSSLLIYLLQRGDIDGAAVTRWSRSDPLTPETVVARTPEEILEAAGSKYCPVPAAGIARRILASNGRFAFVGTPCQVHAIRKAEAVIAPLGKSIVLHLGLFCLNVMNLHFPSHMLAKIGLHRREVRRLVYRSKEWRGWPCDMRVTAKDGSVYDLDGHFSRLDPRAFFNPWRCSLCPDKLNEFSDISFGDCRIARHYGVDALPMAFYDNNPGKSDVIARTALGDGILQQAVADRIITLEPTGWDDILRSTGVSDKKLGLAGFSALARLTGRGVPRYHVAFSPMSRKKRVEARLTFPLTVLMSCHFLISDALSAFGWYRRCLRLAPHMLMRLISLVRDTLSSNRRMQRSELIADYSTKR